MQMDTKPFMNIVVAMDKVNIIGHQGKVPWAPLPTDNKWYLTHSTTTKDPAKRNVIIAGRSTFEEASQFDRKYVSRWHFIVITSQSPERFFDTHSNIERDHIDVVHTFEEGARKAKELLEEPSAMIESVYVFGGVKPYEEAMERQLVKRVYLTRVFAELNDCEHRLSKFDLNGFKRIKRSSNELLSEYDDKIMEENGWKYQFQVYERDD